MADRWKLSEAMVQKDEWSCGVVAVDEGKDHNIRWSHGAAMHEAIDHNIWCSHDDAMDEAMEYNIRWTHGAAMQGGYYLAHRDIWYW